jgi:hypothetical protein
MDVIHSDKKTFAQLSDDELDDLISRGQYLPHTVDERSHRSNKKMLLVTQRLLLFTIALFALTIALLLVEIRGIFFR